MFFLATRNKEIGQLKKPLGAGNTRLVAGNTTPRRVEPSKEETRQVGEKLVLGNIDPGPLEMYKNHEQHQEKLAGNSEPWQLRDSCGRGSQPEIEKENLEKVKSTTIRDLPGNSEPWQLRESCGGGSHPEIEKEKLEKVKSTTIRDLPGNGEPWQFRESCGAGSHPEIEKAKIKITIDKNINKCKEMGNPKKRSWTGERKSETPSKKYRKRYEESLREGKVRTDTFEQAGGSNGDETMEIAWAHPPLPLSRRLKGNLEIPGDLGKETGQKEKELEIVKRKSEEETQEEIYGQENSQKERSKEEKK